MNGRSRRLDSPPSRPPRHRADLSTASAGDLVEIQRSIDDRPRKTLGYMTPSEAYAQVVALTA
ncbi:MAG: hypothetical protein HYX34_05380 [Actinobacteria bacterium]|nr:hypothetical protein [Actinomycetota bacterium]